MISAKLNVMKIDKSKLFTGKDGTYLDILLIPTPNNAHGNDYMVVQSLSKADRDAGKKSPILGNAKIIGAKPAAQQQAPPPTQQSSGWGVGGSDDLPF